MLRLGWHGVKCTSIHHLKTELAEIDENLVRQELTELERAEHLVRRKEIYEAMYPEATEKERERLGGKLRHNPAIDTVSMPESFAKETARKTGLTERTIQRGVQIGTKIPQDVRDLIRHTPLADQKRELLELVRRQLPAPDGTITDSGQGQHVLRVQLTQLRG